MGGLSGDKLKLLILKLRTNKKYTILITYFY